jgi:hypothetical protein
MLSDERMARSRPEKGIQKCHNHIHVSLGIRSTGVMHARKEGNMSYGLNLHFEPSIDRTDFLAHFTNRTKNYSLGESQIDYKNAATGTNFIIRYRSKRSLFSKRSVFAAEVEMNYFRPSYFGLEAEIEVSSLVAKFRPSVDDPQLRGMGQGPYSSTGFLEGWNYGNSFAVRAILSKNPAQGIPTMAAEKLRAAWMWNYQKPEWLAKANDLQFVPNVNLVTVRGIPSLMAVWAIGMPILLPKVDYVLVGRDDAGTKRYGLSPWSEVLEVVRRAGIDVGSDPLDIKYPVTPDPIAKWVAEIPEIDLQTLPRLSYEEVIDTEIVAMAT